MSSPHVCSRPQGRVQASWLAAAGSWESSRPTTATTVGGSLVEGAGGGIGRRCLRRAGAKFAG